MDWCPCFTFCFGCCCKERKPKGPTVGRLLNCTPGKPSYSVRRISSFGQTIMDEKGEEHEIGRHCSIDLSCVPHWSSKPTTVQPGVADADFEERILRMPTIAEDKARAPASSAQHPTMVKRLKKKSKRKRGKAPPVAETSSLSSLNHEYTFMNKYGGLSTRFKAPSQLLTISAPIIQEIRSDATTYDALSSSRDYLGECEVVSEGGDSSPLEPPGLSPAPPASFSAVQGSTSSLHIIKESDTEKTGKTCGIELTICQKKGEVQGSGDTEQGSGDTEQREGDTEQGRGDTEQGSGDTEKGEGVREQGLVMDTNSREVQQPVAIHPAISHGVITFTACINYKQCEIVLKKLAGLCGEGINNEDFSVIVKLYLLPNKKPICISPPLVNTKHNMDNVFNFYIKDSYLSHYLRLTVLNSKWEGEHDCIGHALLCLDALIEHPTLYTMHLYRQSQPNAEVGLLEASMYCQKDYVNIILIRALKLESNLNKSKVYSKVSYYSAGKKCKEKLSKVCSVEGGQALLEQSVRLKVDTTGASHCYVMACVKRRDSYKVFKHDRTVGRLVLGPYFYTEGHSGLTPWGRIILNGEQLHYAFPMYL